MAIVTSIVPSPKRPGRFEVLVDGEAMGAVSIETIERLKLAVGAHFDLVRSAFDAELALTATWDRAMNMLAFRARSRVELRRQLVQKGEDALRVDQVLERLERAGYLDDADFARQFARSKALGSGMSRRRVQQELARKGVAREVANAAIANTFAEEGVDEQGAVMQAAARKLRTLASLDPTVQRRRLYAFLARRGYESDDILRVLDALGVGGTPRA